MSVSDDALERIRRLASRDGLMRLLGMRCLDGGLGRAAVELTVRDDHLNYNGTAHGGAIFALASTAFGLAANSYGVIAAGVDAHITYQVAPRAGDTLTATATEVSRTSKLGVYRIDVTRQDGALVSTFTGTVYFTARPNDGAP